MVCNDASQHLDVIGDRKAEYFCEIVAILLEKSVFLWEWWWKSQRTNTALWAVVLLGVMEFIATHEYTIVSALTTKVMVELTRLSYPITVNF